MDIQTIELHRLDTKYAHIRIMDQVRIRRLADSILRHGQIEPMVVLEAETLVLIDGYKRNAALQYLERDTGKIRIETGAEDHGLFQLLLQGSSRRWEVIEEAGIIQELHSRFGCSLSEIGRRIGRDKSFVKRRLDLLEALPEEILKLVMSGTISTWAASRVLVPLARANAADAVKLAAYLEKEPASTRQLRLFHEHYQKSNREIRRRMIDSPGLFLKSIEVMNNTDDQGPEEKWLRDANAVCGILQRLHARVPSVFYPEQEKKLRRRLLIRAARTRSMSLELRDRIKECLQDVKADQGTTHQGIVQKRGD
jgi:ParB/RepB/Spo0J family partition protein